MTQTAKEKMHEMKANRLVEEGARRLDAVKTGISPEAAGLLTRANVEREKAGLIKGALQK